MTAITILSCTSISFKTRETTEIVVKIVSSSPVWVRFRFGPRALRTSRNLLFLRLLFSRIIIIFLRVNWYDWVLWNPTFANRADHNIARLIHPGVDARPTIQMTAFTHNGLFGLFKADVTFETWNTWFAWGACWWLCARGSFWLFTFFCCLWLRWSWRGTVRVLLRGVETHAAYVNAFFRKDCYWLCCTSSLNCFLILLLLLKVFRCDLYTNHLFKWSLFLSLSFRATLELHFYRFVWNLLDHFTEFLFYGY